MKRTVILSLLAAAAALAGNAFRAGAAQEARLLRFPTTNGTEVVFTYAGDLYRVPIGGGQAQRLTSHIGYEMFPKYSPDGRSIAFTGQYDGNTEVYLIPAEGGEPVRLTYTATNERDDIGDRMGPNNIVMAWSPDGSRIVYRNRISEGFDGKLWTISPEGGMSEEVPLPEGGACCYSLDGKLLAYNRVMREFRNWKYYRGGMADDIWLYDPQAGTVTNLTENDAQDIFPMWIGEEIFFISDRDHTMNVFVYNTVSKTTEKVTDFTEYDVKFPSTNGQLIVYENGGYIYRLDPKTRRSEKIEITLSSDNVYGRSELKDVSGNVTAASLSPDGRRVAVTARGEVFDVPVGSGVTKDITRTPGSNDRDAVWSPDGKWIAYIGDSTGETEVWLQAAEGGDPVQLTKDNDTYIRSLYWAPDSKHIYYTDRRNRIVELSPEGGAKRTVQENPAGEFRGLAFSPDSKWVAYTKSGDNEMSVIYVYNLDTGKEYPVTEKWYDSSSPVFSSDGKYLIFDSERDFNPSYSQVEWNFSYSRMGGLYIALLAADTPSPLLPKDGAAEDEGPGAGPEGGKGGPHGGPGAGPEGGKGPGAEPGKGPGADGKGPGSDGKAVSVKIDPEGLPQRIVKVNLPAGRYNVLYSDGRKIYYMGGGMGPGMGGPGGPGGPGGGIKVYDLKEQKEDSAGEGFPMDITADGKKALFRSGAKLTVLDAPFKGGPNSPTVDLSGLKAPVDYSLEWPQIFNEVWRAYRDGFYLENMHGADWQGIHDKYAVLLPYVKTRLDLNYVISEMIAELACGHAYVNPGRDVPRPSRVETGLLGAKISRESGSGFYRIDHLLLGAPYRPELRSPLTEPGLEVKEGDYIVSVDGISTDSVDNIYKLLVGKANTLVELGVNSAAKADGARKIVVKPVSDEYPLYHYEWVQNNLRRVEEATDGRVGYIYIPDMGPEGLNEFARYYYAQLDKEALIIDDRANGGGNVSPMIIERLLREPYRLTMRRGSDKIGTVPDGTQVGPKVLLINKYSASDGDLFPWSFKATGIGTVIGTRTWGGIIGISGSLPYMDGTDVRVPFFTNYDAKTGQWIVENHGVDPDILIDNDPVREFAGTDDQLEKAIEVVLEQLKDRQPLPPVPAPRTYKDLGVQE